MLVIGSLHLTTFQLIIICITVAFLIDVVSTCILKSILGSRKKTKFKKDNEYIICSAIWYKELELKKPHLMDNARPVNIDTGIVFGGYRHNNCMMQMNAITGLSDHKAGNGVQGFWTNKNRFVNREDGAKIAIDSGQVKKLKYSSDKLFSEDLY